MLRIFLNNFQPPPPPPPQEDITQLGANSETIGQNLQEVALNEGGKCDAAGGDSKRQLSLVVEAAGS